MFITSIVLVHLHRQHGRAAQVRATRAVRFLTRVRATTLDFAVRFSPFRA